MTFNGYAGAALAKLAHQVRDDERGRILMGRWMRDYLQAYGAMRAARASFARRDRWSARASTCRAE